MINKAKYIVLFFCVVLTFAQGFTVDTLKSSEPEDDGFVGFSYAGLSASYELSTLNPTVASEYHEYCYTKHFNQKHNWSLFSNVEFNLGSWFAFRMGIGYKAKGAGSHRGEFLFNCLEIPLLIKLYVPVHGTFYPVLLAGISPSYVISAKTNITQFEAGDWREINMMENLATGFLMGFGVEKEFKKNRLYFNIILDLNNEVKLSHEYHQDVCFDDPITFTSLNIGFNIGYMFNIKPKSFRESK